MNKLRNEEFHFQISSARHQYPHDQKLGGVVAMNQPQNKYDFALGVLRTFQHFFLRLKAS